MPDADPIIELPGDDATLDAILASAWSLLERGARLATEDLHWPVLASVDARIPEHAAADARVVVLRRVDRDARVLETHSDLRAHKVAQLRAAPRACLVFHDRARGLQLRARGEVRVHAADAVARRAWDVLGRATRRAYMVPRTPGTRSDAPDRNLPEALVDLLPDEREAAPAFAHFAVIALGVRSLEWLRLGRSGHQRARFDMGGHGSGNIDASWIRP